MQHMLRLTSFLLIAAFAHAQEKTVAQLEAEKRDPKKRAEKLLDSAAGLTASVHADTMVAALANIGDQFQVLDQKKAAEYLRQAFTTTAALADHPSKNARSQAQGDIVRLMTPINVREAAAMLQQMEPPAKGYDARVFAAGEIAAGLAKKNDFDTAMSVIDTLGGTGSFPYRAAQLVFKAMPAEDPRRLSLFASATSAYSAKQDNAFGRMLVACWDDLPSGMAQSALDTFVKQIAGAKEENDFTSTTMSGPKGAVHFDRKSDAELFNVMYLVSRMNPKKAKEILESRPALKAALDKFPEGPKSIEVQNTMVQSSSKPAENSGELQLDALAKSRAAAAIAALSKDPEKALSLASEIPVADVRAYVLATIARSVAEDDPVTANAVLGKCMALLDEVKQPFKRLDSWVAVAAAAHKVKDDQTAQKAISRLLADANDMLKEDANEDSPNQAARDYWPSTGAYRKAMIAAAETLGVDAEPLLSEIKDPDMRLLAQIDLAAAWLGRARQSWSWSVSRSK